jgi:sulfite exporter TauE/SafE
VGLFAMIMLAHKFGTQFSLPEINSQTGNGMIFLVGLITGLHCVGMCGSFIIGCTAKDAGQSRSVIGSHIWYGVGKTLSYAMLGAIFGFAGSFFHITPLISGISISLAGAPVFRTFSGHPHKVL